MAVDTQKQQAAKIMQRFESAKRKRQAVGKDEKWKELDAFDRGQQWDLETGKKLPPWVPRPVTNYVHLVKTTKRAALAIENPTGLLLPQGPEDQESVEKLQKAYEFEWERIKMRKYVRDSIDTGKLLGTAIVQLYYDESDGVQGVRGKRYEGTIKARLIDPGSLYPDPNAFEKGECEYIHVVYRKSLAWIKKHPKFGKNAAKIESRELASSEQGEIYNRDYTSETAKDRLVDFHEHYEKIADDDGGFHFKVTYLAAGVVLHEVERIRPNRYPFAIYYDFKQRQDFWGIGTCEYILDNQKLINKVESVIALIGTLLQNPQKVIGKNSGIDPQDAAKNGDAPGHTYVANGDPTRAIHWMQPPQIPPALFNLANQAKENIREITGLTESYMGQSVGSLQTSQGVDSLIERSTLRDRDQMYDLELFIEDLSVLLIEFITEYYDDERYMRIIDPQTKKVTFEEFNGAEFKDLQFDMHIDVSAKAPITRARRKQELHQLLTLQGQMQFNPSIIKPQEYMKYSDFVDSEKLIERMNMEEIMNAQTILQETAQMMIEAIDQGVNPEEAGQMGMAMVEQRLGQLQSGTGSTSANAGQMQARQGAGPTV